MRTALMITAGPGRGPRAFSLAELAVVIAVSSMLFLSLSAALSGTLDATVEVADKLGAWQMVSSALLSMERDLSLATVFVTTQARQVSFYVPDITGDSAADLVTYSWSGTPGQPLQRSVNGGAAVTVMPEAQDVAFSYNYRQRQIVAVTPSSRELSVTCGSFIDYGTRPTDTVYCDVSPSAWRAQSFTPLTDATSAKSAVFRAYTSSYLNNGTRDLQVILIDKETGQSIAEGTLSKYSLDYYTVRTFTVPFTWQADTGSAMSTLKDCRLLFRPSGTLYSCTIEAMRVTSGSGPSNGTMYEYSTNSGASYANLGDQADIRHVIYGTAVLQYGVNAEQTDSRLRRVDIRLGYGTGKNAAAVNSAVRLGNL